MREFESTSDDRLTAARNLFTALRRHGCEFSLGVGGVLRINGDGAGDLGEETRDQLRALADELGMVVCEVGALERIARERCAAGSGVGIARALLALDPGNELGINILTTNPDPRGLFAALEALGFTLSRSPEDREKITVAGDKEGLAAVITPAMKNAIAARRETLLALIDENSERRRLAVLSAGGRLPVVNGGAAMYLDAIGAAMDCHICITPCADGVTVSGDELDVRRFYGALGAAGLSATAHRQLLTFLDGCKFDFCFPKRAL